MACRADKSKCEWITGSHADSEEGGSVSGPVASSSRVSGAVASSPRVSGASSSQPETRASVDALREIAEAIRDVQRGQEERLRRVEDNAQRSLDAVERLVQVLIDGGARKVAEWELVSSADGSQRGDGASLLMDYDQEQAGESEGRGGVETS
jgi:hypothetical protein